MICYYYVFFCEVMFFVYFIEFGVCLEIYKLIYFGYKLILFGYRLIYFVFKFEFYYGCKIRILKCVVYYSNLLFSDGNLINSLIVFLFE